MNGVEFANSYVLWFLLLVPLLWLWHFLRFRKRNAKVLLPTLFAAEPLQSNGKLWLFHGLFILKTIAVGLLIVAIARPQSSSSWQNVNTKGIDIVLAMDISGSMLARDLQPNRLEASKEVAIDFVNKRINDRIGLVIYAGESFTQAPLTTDHSVMKNMLDKIENGMIEDGTAIGMGLATSISRLKESNAVSKVVILLTDGSNNSGAIPPLTAAEIAKTYGIKVYTIGVGTNGVAPMPVRMQNGRVMYQNQQVYIDESTLEKIAAETGGKYFRATDNASLEEIYSEIDLLEKTEIDVKEYRKKDEQFYPWALGAALLLFLGFILNQLLIKSITLNG